MDKRNIILFRKFTWLVGQEYSEVTEDDITVECFLIDQYLAETLPWTEHNNSDTDRPLYMMSNLIFHSLAEYFLFILLIN